MSQILHGTYLYSIFICYLSKIQMWLGTLYFYLQHLATLNPRYASSPHDLWQQQGEQQRAILDWLQCCEGVVVWDSGPPFLHLWNGEGDTVQRDCCKHHYWSHQAPNCHILCTCAQDSRHPQMQSPQIRRADEGTWVSLDFGICGVWEPIPSGYQKMSE